MGGALNELSSLRDFQPGLPRESNLDGQAGLATYVAPIFNTVAYPPNLPAIKIEALEREAALIQQQPGHITFAYSQPTDREAKEKRERDAEDHADMQVGIILQNQQQMERDRAEWSRETHSMAGQTLTGKQWGELGEGLKQGGANRDWLIRYLMQHGQTRDDAEKKAKDMQLAAEGMSKPERDRSPEEKAAMKRIDANPESKATFDRFLEAKAKGFPATAEQSAQMTSSTQTASTSARADALNDEFANAPNLRDHHRAALAATEPLSTPPAAQPSPISSAQPNANAGLDR